METHSVVDDELMTFAQLLSHEIYYRERRRTSSGNLFEIFLIFHFALRAREIQIGLVSHSRCMRTSTNSVDDDIYTHSIPSIALHANDEQQQKKECFSIWNIKCRIYWRIMLRDADCHVLRLAHVSLERYFSFIHSLLIDCKWSKRPVNVEWTHTPNTQTASSVSSTATFFFSNFIPQHFNIYRSSTRYWLYKSNNSCNLDIYEAKLQHSWKASTLKMAQNRCG